MSSSGLSYDEEYSEVRNIAMALYAIAVELKYLGNGNASTQMGALEAMSVKLFDGMTAISQSLFDGVTAISQSIDSASTRRWDND